MPVLRITGVPALDGDYPLNIGSFTNRELHLIKKESGVRAGEIEEAFNAGDNDLLVAIAIITVAREGKGRAEQISGLLWDAEVGAISFDFTEDEQAEAGEDVPPLTGPESSSGPDAASGSSGRSSGNGSESPATHPSHSGGRTSPTTAISDQATLVISPPAS